MKIWTQLKKVHNAITYKVYTPLNKIKFLLNLLLFIPFGYLCLLNTRKDAHAHYVRKALKYTALFSCGIEVFQILLRVGTFQISDLFFNILGGALGGVIYWIVRGVGIIPKDSDI